MPPKTENEIRDVDLLAIGAALVDILTPVGEFFLHLHDLQKGHMHLIDDAKADALQAEVDSGTGVEGARRVSGGSAANTALGVAAAGGTAAFLGAVADDTLGQLFARDLAAQTIDFGNIVDAATAPTTGRCYCFITREGERTMATYLGASAAFADTAAGTAASYAARARLTYVEGYIWDTPVRVATAAAALRSAKAHGRQTALSLSDGWCASAYRDTFLRLLSDGLVDILFANEAEVLALTATADFASACLAVRRLVPLAVCTRGADGAAILTQDGTVTIAAQPIDKVVDATGAGDLFAAGFLAGHLRGLPLDQCGRMGAAAAAEIISHLGARPETDLQALLARA